MSDSNAPKSSAAGPGAAMEDPIVAKAKQAMGELFASTIAALGGDVKKLLNVNAPTGPVGKVFQVFTGDMIDLLSNQVKSVLPGGSSTAASSSSPSSSGPSQEPKSGT